MDSPARPRVLSFLLALGVSVVAIAYVIPLATTGDPLWFLPTDTRADRLLVHWDGRTNELTPAHPRYRSLMDAVNRALSSPQGIEYRYGISADDVGRLRAAGRAVEAEYRRPATAHGLYALGPFTRLLVPLSGEEHERRLLFVGGEGGYRAGPLRIDDLERLRALAEEAR